MNLLRFCAATLVSSLALACGSSDTGDETEPVVGDPNDPNMMVDPTDPGNLACNPDAEIPCIEGIAEPCTTASGWLGDEYCLAEPDPGSGIQLHVGPSDYDDPAIYERWVINPGEETNWAEVMTMPNTEIVYTNGYYSFMRPGSHHFILYSVPSNTYQTGAQTTAGGAESAVGALDGQFRAGATRAIQRAVLDTDEPEDQGIGQSWDPQATVAANMHFINSTEEPLLQELWVNFRTIEREDIVRWANPITWYGGIGMNIAPGEHVTLTNPEASCAVPNLPDVRISGMTGHVHASTLRYNATAVFAGQTERTILFEDYDWHEPSEFRYSNAIENGTADPATQTNGGYSGLLMASPGDQFYWECEIQNESGGFLSFSNQVYTGEMCNVFGFFSSPQEQKSNWLCAFF